MKSLPPASRSRAALLALALCAASFGIALSANKDYAPADAYFGRMKMSFLGINNTFQQQQAFARPHSTDSGIVNKIYWADEALHDWQKRYPKDPQIARSYFMGQQVMKMIWLKEYQDKAWSYMNLIAQRFPATFFGKTVKKEMEIGFTEHWYAAAVPCEADGSEPAVKPPLPSIAPKGKLKFEVLDQPCFTPKPTPSPAPTATPAASFTPAVLPVPAASGPSMPSPPVTLPAVPSAAATLPVVPSPAATLPAR